MSLKQGYVISKNPPKLAGFWVSIWYGLCINREEGTPSQMPNLRLYF